MITALAYSLCYQLVTFHPHCVIYHLIFYFINCLHFQLEFDSIRVTGAEISIEGGRTNEFATFWQQDDIDLSRGLDFQPRGSVFARITHLQHAPFTYRIRVRHIFYSFLFIFSPKFCSICKFILFIFFTTKSKTSNFEFVWHTV